MRKQSVGVQDLALSEYYLSAVSDNVLDNEKLQVDFKPLFQCIHIYTALDSLDELRKSYQADRRVSFLPLPPLQRFLTSDI